MTVSKRRDSTSKKRSPEARPVESKAARAKSAIKPKVLQLNKPATYSKKTSAKTPEAPSSPVAAVVLPTNMSVRTVDKASAWEAFFAEELPTIAYHVSSISAIAFVVVGAAFCVSGFIAPGALQTAQVLSTLDSNNTSVPGTQTMNGVVDPTVTLLDALPDQLLEEARFAVTTTGITALEVVGESLQTGKRHIFKTEFVAGSSYRFTIPANQLPPSSYVVRAVVRTTTASHTFKLGAFSVPEPHPVPVSNLSEPDNTAADDTITSLLTATPATTTPDNAESPSEPVLANPESVDDVLTERQIDHFEFEEKFTETNNLFSVTTPSPVVTGWVPVRITAPTTFGAIELYIRPERALNERFLGTATKNFDRWFYTFNSENIPNGTYQLIARTTVSGRVQSSSVWVFAIANTVETLNTTSRIDTSSSSATSPAYVFEPTPDRATTVDEQIIEVANRTFIADQESITDLLERYAAAIKINDKTLLTAIEHEFNVKRNNLLELQLVDASTKDIAAALDVEFEARFTELKERVRAFETIRKERNVDTLDTDGDGISDDDESLLYGTSPSNPDSDGDGYLDGVEIIRGFDPLNDKPEALIEYELPTEVVGLEREDVLSIKQVIPFIDNSSESEQRAVFAEITGTGLPNSFVTLYVFSTPTVVTVKTDADGSFVYRFDKELQDGKHDVYAAFTDNTGAILAKSPPFSFVKQAEAFTPSSEAATYTTSDKDVTTSLASNSYSLVFGLAIISFGLILLMLGISIKPRSRVTTVTPS